MILQSHWTILQDEAVGHDGVGPVANTNWIKQLQLERDAVRTQGLGKELVERLARAVRDDGTAEPLPGLHLARCSSATEPLHAKYLPAFCVIAQGSKEVCLGNERFQYDPAHYLLATVELPVVVQVLEASKERPYLALALELDVSVVGSVMIEGDQPSPRRPGNVKAMAVSSLDAHLLDAVVRLVRLVNSPGDARFLQPLVTREIVYRLLTAEQGSRLRHIAVDGGYSDRIGRAVERLRTDFDRPLRIESIARELNMSVSSLHHQFKAVTGMSPLQYHKRFRLQEARRLMLGGQLDAASVAHRVGYDDASQFNREYKRLFGAPPLRDVRRLQVATGASNGLGHQ
jgi:AraC-like DNA-binding protein